MTSFRVSQYSGRVASRSENYTQSCYQNESEEGVGFAVLQRPVQFLLKFGAGYREPKKKKEINPLEALLEAVRNRPVVK